MMMVFADINVDKEALLAMRLRATQMVFEAEAAVKAFRKAHLAYWQDWVFCKLDTYPTSKHPVICELTDTDGTRLVRVCGIDVDSERPQIRFNERLKSGKWGKTDFYHDLPIDLKKDCGTQ